MLDSEIEEQFNGHSYSGWPGAYCLKCGQEDPDELILAGFSEQEVVTLRRKCPKEEEVFLGSLIAPYI